ncbi:MAG: hypothetical protein RSC49_01110 [Clostridium sp.]
MEKAKKDHPEWWTKKKLKMHELVEGPHFNEAYASMLINNMVNVDGTKGGRWDYEEATKILSTWVTGEHPKYNEYDWWLILNMMNSDYSDIIGQKPEMSVAMTRAYFDGPDEEEGKAWYQFKHKLKKALTKKEE